MLSWLEFAANASKSSGKGLTYARLPEGINIDSGRRHGDMADHAPLAQLRKVGVDSGRAPEAEARHYPIAEAGNGGKGPAGVVRSEERGPIALRNDLVHRLLEENRSLKDELEAVKVQLADAKALSEAMGKELLGTQMFLTKADTLSTTDVVQRVNALNEEIFLAAAYFGEMLRNTERTDRTQEEVTVAFEKARWMLGDHMASILGAESMNLRTELNPLLVEVVLQIAITTWCKFVVSSWKPSDGTVADFLAAIYSEIRQVEDQAVPGRWRSITRAQLRSSSDDWTANLMNGLLSVLVIAGWSTREPDQQHHFERRLLPIFKAVQDLRKALGEDVTSMDMEVAVIDAGDPFNPTYMEDGYGDARASSGSGKKVPEKVSGTTGLGLQKISMKQTSKGPVAHSEMVLFPKVVLEGTVKEAMDPPPPPAWKLRKKAKTDRPGNGGGGGGGGGAPPATGGTGAGGMLQSASSFVSQAEGQAVAEAQDHAIAEAGNIREGGPDVTAPSGVVRSDQMHMQQQQLPEVAQAIAPKPSDSHSSTAVLETGVGGSSDQPQSSKEKSLHRKILELENAWQQEKTSNVTLDHHYRKLWNRANAQSEELQRSQSQVHRLLDDVRSLTHELEAVKSQLADAKTLSESRGKLELKELKVDTTDVDQKDEEEEPWDMPEESDIFLTAGAIQMVDVLNVEVRRVASVLGKLLQKTKLEEGHCQSIQITERARLMLGENMVALLSAGLPDRARVDPLFLQVVLQVAIINWCKINISSWKPGNSDVSNLLGELYSKIRQVEDPTFYHRWRSVTWAQMEFSSSGWSQDLLDGLLDIFAFARWPTPNVNQKTLFEEQFPPIFNAIRDLRKALGEDITSIDIEVATIDPGTTFDSAFMDNGWPAFTKENTLEIVSGTTSLGLKKVIMKPSAEGDSLAPNADVICRPKVILERTVQEALVPPSSRAQKKGLPKRGAAAGDGRG